MWFMEDRVKKFLFDNQLVLSIENDIHCRFENKFSIECLIEEHGYENSFKVGLINCNM